MSRIPLSELENRAIIIDTLSNQEISVHDLEGCDGKQEIDIEVHIIQIGDIVLAWPTKW